MYPRSAKVFPQLEIIRPWIWVELVQKNKDFAKAMPTMLALTGIDIVAATFKRWKHPLKTFEDIDKESLFIGRPEARLYGACSSVTAFLIACFGMTYTDCKSMVKSRLKMWKKCRGWHYLSSRVAYHLQLKQPEKIFKRVHYQQADSHVCWATRTRSRGHLDQEAGWLCPEALHNHST